MGHREVLTSNTVQSHFVDKIKGQGGHTHSFIFDRYHKAQDFVEEKFHLKPDRAKRFWKTEYTGEQLSIEASDQFESIYHQSIELYHRYL